MKTPGDEERDVRSPLAHAASNMRRKRALLVGGGRVRLYAQLFVLYALQFDAALLAYPLCGVMLAI